MSESKRVSATLSMPPAYADELERMRDVLLRTRCAHEDAHKSLILDAGLEDTMRTLNVPERYWH